MAVQQRIKVEIVAVDILDLGADILALQWGHGEVWDSVQRALGDRTNHRAPGSPPGAEPFKFYESPRSIAAERVLLVGGHQPARFGYDEMREFVHHTLKFIAENAPNTRHVALVVYGANEGHNETQALRKEFDGVTAAVAAGDIPAALQTISFVVPHRFLAAKLAPLLTLMIPGGWLETNSVQKKAD